MSDLNTNQNPQDVLSAYEKDGYVFPIEILSQQDALQLRLDLEQTENELKGTPDKADLLNEYPHRLLPSFDQLIRHPKILSLVSQVLGQDLLVWNTSLFSKPAKSNKIVSWHQDLTYWQLDDSEEVTVWVALSPASLESGCMKFVAGSHKQRIVPHRDTYADDNMLSRGQEIEVTVRPEEEVPVLLQPGQASIHHGHLFHGSGPNISDDRRIGVAIRYIKPSMKQNTGDKPMAILVSGKDNFGHFQLALPPKKRLDEAEIEECRKEAALLEKILL